MLDEKNIIMIIIFILLVCMFNIWRIININSRKYSVYERIVTPPIDESPPNYEQIINNSV